MSQGVERDLSGPEKIRKEEMMEVLYVRKRDEEGAGGGGEGSKKDHSGGNRLLESVAPGSGLHRSTEEKEKRG